MEPDIMENSIEPYFRAEHIRSFCGAFMLDVSFSCCEHTMTCIVGPSGSGKSTTLKIIAGLVKPDPAAGLASHGDAGPVIMLGGRNIAPLAPAKRGVGMVFQKPVLFNHMRVDDNVAYGLRCRGMGRKEDRAGAAELLERFGLGGFGNRLPETLSGGEAQRVCLARTLIVEPALILFDEPLSALDAPLRKKLAAEIRERQQESGFTGIMVTHDIHEAKSISDYIILIKKGRITWQGAADDFQEDMIS